MTQATPIKGPKKKLKCLCGRKWKRHRRTCGRMGTGEGGRK